jgi:hypothetical protein
LRRWLVALLALCLAGTVGSSALAAARKKPGPRFPAHMLVFSQEWSLTLSRASVPHGKVSVELYNRGQDAHNLNIRRLRHGNPVGATEHVKLTQSGSLNQASWKLPRGRYVLYCSLPGHEQRGMKAVLTVG